MRYLVLSTAAFQLVRSASPEWQRAHQLQPLRPAKEAVISEVKNSARTVLIFGVVLGSLLSPLVLPFTKISVSGEGLSWIWMGASFFLLLLIHDSYFYFMHLLMHTNRFLRQFHHIHHRSTNPTPYASQSFHWVEAVLEIIWIVPVVFLVPLSRGTLIAFSFFTIIYNIYGHLGYEILSSRARSGPWLRYFNTSTHHNLHHKNYLSGNYGLYFLFWDKFFKTEKLS